MREKPKFHSKMIKDGRWTVAVSTGYGPVSHVGNFATEEEANRWIATDSKNWSQPAVCTENRIRVDDVMESSKLAK